MQTHLQALQLADQRWAEAIQWLERNAERGPSELLRLTEVLEGGNAEELLSIDEATLQDIMFLAHLAIVEAMNRSELFSPAGG
jgi:hypothetical protein